MEFKDVCGRNLFLEFVRCGAPARVGEDAVTLWIAMERVHEFLFADYFADREHYGNLRLSTYIDRLKKNAEKAGLDKGHFTDELFVERRAAKKRRVEVGRSCGSSQGTPGEYYGSVKGVMWLLFDMVERGFLVRGASDNQAKDTERARVLLDLLVEWPQGVGEKPAVAIASDAAHCVTVFRGKNLDAKELRASETSLVERSKGRRLSGEGRG